MNNDDTLKTLKPRHRLEVAVRTLLSPAAGGRSENQDNYLVIDADGNARYLDNQQQACRRVEGWPEGHVRLAILDGMGGHTHGREAAEKTVAGLLRIAPTADLARLSAGLEALHAQLHQEMHVGLENPGCTLTLVEIPPAQPALLFHAGDSRLYALDASGPACLTIDHVPATKYAIHGYLTEADWTRQVFEQPHSLLCQAFVLGNNLGSQADYADGINAGLFELHDSNLPPFLRGCGDRRPITLESHRVYLLASDGLWHLDRPMDFISRWPDILVRPDRPLDGLLEDLFDALVQESASEAWLPGDNCTAVAFRLAPPAGGDA
ncbi:MAG: protein phosphatase [Pseudomonadota bacterium]|nr:protein phosphatase [Pseudomonadota bacterium]